MCRPPGSLKHAARRGRRGAAVHGCAGVRSSGSSLPAALGAAARPALRRRMSWTCHGSDNTSLVGALASKGLIVSPRIEAALLAIDRAVFCPVRPYIDAPQPIGHSATISAPHMHAMCLELLADHLHPGANVLDVGSGSGYLTAAMAHIVCGDGSGGRVVGVEHIPQLVAASEASCRQVAWVAELMQRGQVLFVEGDGQMGVLQHAPYNVIHVGAAAPEVPEALVEQLAPGGRLLIPVGPEGSVQDLVLVDKLPDGTVNTTKAMNVMYVPLTDRMHVAA